MNKIILSSLNHTWLLDLDGTMVKHNGYKNDGRDSLLPGALEFLQKIDENDMIIFITSRKKKYKKVTEDFFAQHNIRYDYIIYDAPFGERIVINDNKMSGVPMAKKLCLNRDEGPHLSIQIDNTL